MSLFTPTAFYFSQPVAASAGGYIIRPDTYASSVTIAIPGTKFGTTFNQTSYRSDISGYINGGSSLPELPVSGSGQTTNTATNFSAVPYGTSMSRGTSSNLGACAGNTTNVNFGSGAWTVEYWMYLPTGQTTADQAGVFAYDQQIGFINCTSSGTRFRWVRDSTSGEALYDYIPGGVIPSANTWYHVAMSYNGSGTTYCAYNGIIRGTISLGGTVNTSSAFGILGWNGNGGQGTGYFQDFRVTKGVARYTGSAGSSYTVPGSIVTTG
jgi:hypothetical protein